MPGDDGPPTTGSDGVRCRRNGDCDDDRRGGRDGDAGGGNTSVVGERGCTGAGAVVVVAAAAAAIGNCSRTIAPNFEIRIVEFAEMTPSPCP